jgi:hypothetical protein
MPVIENKPQNGHSVSPVIEGVIAVIINVTELKEREHDVQVQVQEKQQANAASRLKSQFLANVRLFKRFSCRYMILTVSDVP